MIPAKVLVVLVCTLRFLLVPKVRLAVKVVAAPLRSPIVGPPETVVPEMSKREVAEFTLTGLGVAPPFKFPEPVRARVPPLIVVVPV